MFMQLNIDCNNFQLNEINVDKMYPLLNWRFFGVKKLTFMADAHREKIVAAQKYFRIVITAIEYKVIPSRCGINYLYFDFHISIA